jgi:long-chain-fatty-acid--CoA ligase ACSBG
MAAMCCGAKAVGIYPTDTAEQVIYKTKHSGAAVAVIEDGKKLQRFAGKLAEVPRLKAFVMYLMDPESAKMGDAGDSRPVHAWQAFLALGDGRPELAESLEARRRQIAPGHACALVYTSGTTGMPKAVMVSHDNLMTVMTSVLHMYRYSMGVEYDQERIISYLPLSHVAAFQVDIVSPVMLTGRTQGFTTVYFARPYDLKDGTLKNRLTFVRPTFFLGVPRVYEKFQEALQEAGKKTAALTGLQARMPIICCIKKTSCIRWSKKQGLNSMRELQVGGTGHTSACYGLAEAAILSKVRSALGLDACKGMLSGAAPISQETLEFFGALGINILEVYGMSECGGLTTMSIEERHLWGSCGFEAPGMQVKAFQVNPNDMNVKQECPATKQIFNPSEMEQGELCFRGRHVMMGYLANPDLGPEHMEEIRRKTEEAIDDEVWLHSGDRGCIDSDGMVRVTGRYKELIITAGGENLAPVPIEECIKQNCPAISNAMMVGDKRKYNVCLVTLKAQGATGELPGTEQLAGPALEVVQGITTTVAARDSPEYRKVIEDAIKAANKNSLVCPSNASQVQKFKILSRDFSTEGGELTSTLKLKRKFTEEKHREVIESLYS